MHRLLCCCAGRVVRPGRTRVGVSRLRTRMASSAAAGAGQPKPAYQPSNKEFAVPGLSAQSAWNQKALDTKYPPLTSDISADVVVIGAGIAGLSCAYNLAKAGKKVVVLEARTRGAGQTGRTTAHIMTWLDDYYYECESMHGKEKTKIVAQSLRSAADWIEKVVREEGIDCKFRRLDGYLYPHLTGESSMPTSSTSALKKELDAAVRAGLEDTAWVDLGGGPEVGGIRECLVFKDNAEFHPLMYLEGLAEAVVRHGGKIYEGTKSWKAEDDRVETADGHTIKCDAHVMATNSPCNHNLAVHARQMPYRSYVVGILIPRDKVKRALYWDTAEPYHYIRFDDWDDRNLLMIVGGEDHKTGSLWPYDPYERLEKYARARWTDAGETILRWNGQVMEPADMLYLHGRNPLVPDGSEYIITGDSGQGMTGGTIGGIVVSDLILGRKSPWADVYDPSRAPPFKSLLEVAEEGAITTASFAERVLPLPLPKHGMQADSGTIVQSGVHKVCAALPAASDGTHLSPPTHCRQPMLSETSKSLPARSGGRASQAVLAQVMNSPQQPHLDPSRIVVHNTRRWPSTAMNTSSSTPTAPSAPTWAALCTGTAWRRPLTAPATAPTLTATARSSTGRQRAICSPSPTGEGGGLVPGTNEEKKGHRSQPRTAPHQKH